MRTNQASKITILNELEGHWLKVAYRRMTTEQFKEELQRMKFMKEIKGLA
jgi:hypothetical protein